MSLVQEILYTVSNYPGGYRIIYDILYDGQPPGRRKSRNLDNTLRVTLSKLKKNGFLENKNGKWSITSEGEEFLDSKQANIRRFFPKKTDYGKTDYGSRKDIPKQLVVIFDIPEKQRRYRDWLRIELVSLGFELIQKSVWLGPSLPKGFIEYLEEIKVLKYLKFFHATKKDLI